MNNYESYKKTDIAWLKEIPSHWEIENISHIFEERKEKNIDQKENFILSVVKNIGVIPYTEKGNVGNKASEDTSNYKMVYPNDIVLNSMNMMIGSLGKSEYKGVLSQVYYILKLKEKDKYNINYLTYVFKNQKFYKSLRVLGKGILDHRLRVPMELLKYEKLPIPPINEQIQIANYLDWKINEIDKLILIEKEKIKNINKLMEKQIKGYFENIFKISSKKIRLRFLYNFQNGISTSKDYINGNFPFLTYSDVYRNLFIKEELSGKINSTKEEQKIYSVKKNDLFITRTSEQIEDAGKVSMAVKDIENAVFNGFSIRLRPSFSNHLLGEYVLHYLNSRLVRDKILKTLNLVTRVSIKQEILKNITIPEIIQEEQIKLLLKIEKIRENILNQIMIMNEKIKNLQALKQSLIAEVVTGKIDVRNINIPQYEKVVIVSEVNNNDRMEE